LQKSSNIYCATLVHRIVTTLGQNWYRQELEQTFGFGQKTKIELPGESIGALPTPGKKHPNGRLEWSVPTPYSLAMGHNVQATSLQMIRAYSVFANGGYLVQPTLIRKVVKPMPDGSEVVLLDNTTEERVKNFPKVLEDSIVKDVVKAMKFVTKPGGAAANADIWGYTEAGKTGTTMKLVGGLYSEKSHFASFVGFVPASKPNFAIMVGMDEPAVGFIPGKGLNHFGGTCSAPVFREIGRRSLEYLGVPPDDPAGYPKRDPRHDPAKADMYRETEELKKLYEQWNGKAH
jgi:cell division protein FtsI (penicillin-binding protein 3)